MKNKQRTTNNEQRTYKAFTLIELVVAVALLALVFLFAGTIFKVSINAYRTAVANAEIMQKLRAITDQLNADFKGLRKDGEIFVVWKAEPNSHERFDRIMFFADGDFQSYDTYSGEPLHGDVARICYMLANKPPPYADIGSVPPERPGGQKPEKRILARTQHILTADAQFAGPPPSSLLDWYNWNNIFEYEYDMNSLDKWKNVPWVNKQDMLSVITDVIVDSSPVSDYIWGTMVDPVNDQNTIRNLLCEGVGEFKVQGWYDAEKRWVPEFDSGDFGGLPADRVPGVLYPYPLYGQVILGGGFYGFYFQELLNEAHFNEIPGLGRALKFTFTLYDSKGVIKEGRTFTHIVYLGN
ncbi:MAG: prepilin-type N-terminal cleavage/methylation domain-containing protein [Sedimentisphaerales bacterium]|nr:prepilin-type N-terminal cleavage/methylation domain-containing protein [Sedimentisphaerales bacterium]